MVTPPDETTADPYGGSITVDSKVGEYSEFTIRLPSNS
jgi:signal transduction histidine kinase